MLMAFLPGVRPDTGDGRQVPVRSFTAVRRDGATAPVIIGSASRTAPTEKSLGVELDRPPAPRAIREIVRQRRVTAKTPP